MENIENREIRTIRTFKVPASLLWEAWTDPGHIANWWGPDGFTTTVHTMDFREGGEWKLTLHGPDGINYPNRSTFREIIHHPEKSPVLKIIFEHFNPHFMATICFVPKGEETLLDWSLLFDTAEMREIVAKVHKAEEGQRQNMERLDNYLAGLRRSE